MQTDKNLIFSEAKRSLQEEGQALFELSERINNDFYEVVQLISTARQIFVSGIGKSGLIARKIAATFVSTGLHAVFLHPVEALHGDIGFVGKDDVVILLSKSGSTEEVRRLIPFLKSRSVKLIAIVGNLNSFIATNSDFVLDATVAKESCPFNIAPTTSSIAALALGDALAVCSMRYRNVSIEEFSRNHPLGQIGRNITLQVKDIMHKGDACPKTYINASFKEAVIEITNKGLGCVGIVDENGILQGIITDGDVRRVLQKFDDLKGLNAVDIMTLKPVTIAQSSFLGDALALMERRTSSISVLPVVDEKNFFIGIVRIHDIVQSSL